ncbi:unnamed protein product [Rotaria sp. Silwood2]|nr:unnamed protein product [Rotaria sp. Silwood2]CAF2716190.1 unnamed protein product [Rotaria sp. Silwood2]CAF2958875.1 unnamed protein product [Rotaria sp. Silwood2]CAF3130820.1 unnamed protein product [Rotaria sp. Silwood2]CAF3884204.1 unnamed protein product [Rotaria sp. Silwood2]
MFRKLKKFICIHTSKSDHALRSLNHRDRMRDEAVPSNFDYGQLPASFFSAVDMAREESGYDPVPTFLRRPVVRSEEDLRNQDFDDDFSSFNRSRSKSRHRRFDSSARDGSPQHFHHHPPGTPVKFRRQPVPPELLRPSRSSPFLSRQNSVPSSADMFHQFQQAQQFQHMAGYPQQDMMMTNGGQFFPQVQQPFYPMMYPNANMQPWFMMPQQQMYPFY